MKITKLHIEKYKHLENLDFDFTYQSGDKKGQPLEKICFIGQSATGKTNILNLIIQEINSIYRLISNQNNFEFNDEVNEINYIGHTKFLFNKTELYYDKKSVKYGARKLTRQSPFSGGSYGHLLSEELKQNILLLKSDLISKDNLEIFNSNPIQLIEKYPGLINNINFENHIFSEKITIIDDNLNDDYWLAIILDILKYRKSFSQKMSELINRGLIADTNRLKKEYDKWEKENPNPLKKLAKELNPLLAKLNLQVDYINTEYSIPIKRISEDETIPLKDISTGTKGLLLSFLPLYYFREKASMILIDEPERSLYPDMQIDLMDNYRNIAPNSQFIIATHSPFIAAAFEPDERFILYFDEEGNVKVRRGSSPIGDDPNDILHNDFGLETLLNKTGQQIYDDYLKKKQEVLFEENPAKKEALQNEIEKIGDKYDF